MTLRAPRAGARLRRLRGIETSASTSGPKKVSYLRTRFSSAQSEKGASGALKIMEYESSPLLVSPNLTSSRIW